MHNETTSRHIRSSIELFLMVPIKPGFVQTSEFVATYSSRVSIVLNALFEIRQQKIERGYGEPFGPIELLETIHRVQWTVLEPFDENVEQDPDGQRGRQIRTPQLVLTSHFDSSWEDYFSKLIDIGKPLLDLIFSHCVGYDGNSCLDGYEKFSQFIRRYQRPVNFIYAGSPDVSEHDVGHLKDVLMSSRNGGPWVTVRPGAKTISDQSIGQLIQQRARAHDDRSRAALKSIFALREIRDRLFSEQVELTSPTNRTGVGLFDDAVRSVLQTEPDAFRLGFATAGQQKLASDSGVPPSPAAAHADRPLPWVRSLVAVPDFVPAKDRPALLPIFGGAAAAAPAAQQMLTAAEAAALRADVQGNIFDGYQGRDWSAALLVRCNGPAGYRALIADVGPAVTTDTPTDPQATIFTNLALTNSGLRRAGLDRALLAQFPREFQEGLEERAGLIGDIEENHPTRWQHPELVGGGDRAHLSTVDALVLIYAKTEAERNAEVTRWRNLNRGYRVVHETLTRRRYNAENKPVDPFGFVDPVSQPSPRELPPRAAGGEVQTVFDRDLTSLGEFVLGYPNRFGRKAAYGNLPLFKNGTFLVVRKTAMNKAAFDGYVQSVRRVDSRLSDEDAKLRIVGRRPDGTQDVAPGNDFDYAGDSLGMKCPLHAHMRRANPRIPDAPRIIRRGATYGTWGATGVPSDEYGVLFMAYNASIAEQYEIIQRWLNGGNITNQASQQNDLHVGTPKNAGVPRWAWHNTGSAFAMPDRDDAFATLRWGMYCFVPSKSAITWLATELAQPAPALPASPTNRDFEDAASVVRGEARLKELDALAPELRALEWKRLLEEAAEAGSPQARQADDVWAAIRAHGGVKEAFGAYTSGNPPTTKPPLVVVASEGGARAVLGDNGQKYSVREYAARVSGTLGDHYLAHDVDQTYYDLSAAPNAWFTTQLPLQAFDNAKQIASVLLNEPGIYNQEPHFAGVGKAHPRISISVRDLAQVTVARLCAQWFGMPSVAGSTHFDPLVESLERFLVTSRYTFQARPEQFLVVDAVARGGTIPGDFGADPAGGELGAYLRNVGYHASVGPDAFKKTVMGAVVGFAPPAVGAIIRTLDQWIEDARLWHVLAYVADGSAAGESDLQIRARIKAALAAALGKTPSPTILYRTAARDVTLGGVDIPAGTQVVMPLGSVYADAKNRNSPLPEAWLFGGPHGTQTNPADPPHGCPARDAGLDVIVGIVCALADRTNVLRERRFVLSYDR